MRAGVRVLKLVRRQGLRAAIHPACCNFMPASTAGRLSCRRGQCSSSAAASRACQIAGELHAGGRTVYLSLGCCPSVPLFYRGRQFARWAIDLGLMDDTVQNLPSQDARLRCNPVVGNARGGHLCDPQRLAREGVVLIGRIERLDGSLARVIPDATARLSDAARLPQASSDGSMPSSRKPAHRRTSTLAGLDLGNKVARWTLKRYFRPAGDVRHRDG